MAAPPEVSVAAVASVLSQLESLRVIKDKQRATLRKGFSLLSADLSHGLIYWFLIG